MYWIVGKTTATHDYVLVSLKKCRKGWHQRLQRFNRPEKEIGNNNVDVDYICNETFESLFEWFKCDYRQYRLFDNYQNAESYLHEKMN